MKQKEIRTPIWMCERQNDLVDSLWFVGDFTAGKFVNGRDWQGYVRARRAELACGDAPYLTSRYEIENDGVEERRVMLPYAERRGILERKLLMVDKFTETEDEWMYWAREALKSVYGYDIAESCVKAARENLRLAFMEAYTRRMGRELSSEMQDEVGRILEQNVQVVDGRDGAAVMNFLRGEWDALVGNPPYHMVGGAGGSNDAPIYQEFAQALDGVDVRLISLIVPARWLTAGRENLLGGFRRWLTAGHSRELVIYADAAMVFPQVKLKGGVGYFLYDTEYNGKCRYSFNDGVENVTTERDLAQYDVLIRDPRTVTLVDKVLARMAELKMSSVEEVVSHNTPFGITSEGENLYGEDLRLYAEKTPEHDVLFVYYDKPRRVRRYIDGRQIGKNEALMKKEKVLLPVASGTGNDKAVLGKPEYVGKDSVCSQTYLCAGFKTAAEAKNFVKFLQTKFLRVLVKARKISQSAPRRIYRFVPLEDLRKHAEIDWSKSVAEIDQQLYQKYGFSEEEITFIEREIGVLDVSQ